MRSTLKTPMNQAKMMVLQIIKEQYDEQDLAELRQLLIKITVKCTIISIKPLLRKATPLKT